MDRWMMPPSDLLSFAAVACGVCRFYECEICHALFFSEEDAEKCELSHNAQPTGKGKGR